MDRIGNTIIRDNENDMFENREERSQAYGRAIELLEKEAAQDAR